MHSIPSEDFVSLGRVVKPHGLKGALKVKLFVADAKIMSSIEELYLYHPENGQTRRVTLDNVIESARGIIVRFSGFDLAAAETVRGYHLLVSKDDLPKLREGEYYFFQLLQCEVFSEDGKFLGEVVDIIETGSNDVLVVQKGKPGFDLKEELVPLTREYVLEMNLSDSSIVVRKLDYGDGYDYDNKRTDDLS